MMFPTVMYKGVLRWGTTFESYERKLDTVGTGSNDEADDTEKFFQKAVEEQDILSDSKKKAIIFYPLKEVKEILVIESDDE